MTSAWHFEVVAYEADHYCVECLPDGVTTDDEFVYPITAIAEVDVYPVCCVCRTVHDYMVLTEDGRRALQRKEWAPGILALADERTKELPAYAWPGGYPILYLANGHEVICPKCANDLDKQLRLTGSGVHWEGPPDECEECGAEIESAYGDPDDDTKGTE